MNSTCPIRHRLTLPQGGGRCSATFPAVLLYKAYALFYLETKDFDLARPVMSIPPKCSFTRRSLDALRGCTQENRGVLQDYGPVRQGAGGSARIARRYRPAGRPGISYAQLKERAISTGSRATCAVPRQLLRLRSFNRLGARRGSHPVRPTFFGHRHPRGTRRGLQLVLRQKQLRNLAVIALLNACCCWADCSCCAMKLNRRLASALVQAQNPTSWLPTPAGAPSRRASSRNMSH